MIAAWQRLAFASAAMLACMFPACASSQQSPLLNRLTVSGKPAIDIPGPEPAKKPNTLPADVKKQLDGPTKPLSRGDTLEKRDPSLAEALTTLQHAPTAAHQRDVANAYVRLHILDAAFDHFSDALQLDPRDAAAFDGRARIWRDWGMPQAGLGDAHRAVALATSSAVPLNTLGTLLYQLGRVDEARDAFEQALWREPSADYALKNLCEMLRISRDPREEAVCHPGTPDAPDANGAR